MTEQFPNGDLQALWDAQPAHLDLPNMKELTMSLRQEHRKEQKRLLFLNLQEVIPAIGVFLWFGREALRTESNAWAFFAAALISLGVGGFLVGTSLRQRRLERGFDNTVRGELQRSQSQIQHRVWLYRNIAWWYLLPVLFAIVLALVGAGVDFTATATLVYLLVGLIFTGVLYFVNRKVGRSKYETQLERINGLLADLG